MAARGLWWSAAVALVACGGHPAPAGPTPAPDVVEPDRPTGDAPVERKADPDPGEPSEDGLEVSSTRGSIDPSVVSAKLEPKASAIEACYSSKVGRRKWLGGGLELGWDVAADGTVRATQVAASDLGAWPIEKCVLAIARSINFGAPRGSKPARVTAPLSFSAGSGALAWDDERASKAIGDKLTKLGTCAKGGLAPVNVTITLYLGTRGKVQTVGFSSPSGFADAWADCAEKTILGWSLVDPRGKVAKLSVLFNPAEVADEASRDDRDL